MKNTDKIDIYNLLAQRREIAVIWNTHDVREVRPDLTDDQAWEVLQQVEHEQDASVGITSLTLERVARDLFGLPPAGDTKAAR